MCVPQEQPQPHLGAALAKVWEAQDEGVWEWDDDRDRRPMWMTYQGLSVLTTHALYGYGRPALPA
jgi:hypothetical protein